MPWNLSSSVCRWAVPVVVLTWAAPAAAAKVACVGDSITAGYGLGNASQQSYPAVLQTLLGSKHTVQNFGTSGCTLLKKGDQPYWSDGNFGASGAFGPDLVIIMLGTNDAKPQNWSRKAEFADDYASLIAHYRELGAEVYAATPPPVFSTGAFSISPDVLNKEIVPLVRQIATEQSAPLIDVFSALTGKDSYFPDKIHPNAEGAKLIAQTMAAALQAGLGGTGGASGTGGRSTGVGGMAGSGGSPRSTGGFATGVGGIAAAGGALRGTGGGSTGTGGSTRGSGESTTGSGGVPASGGASASGGMSATGSGGSASGGDAGSVAGSGGKAMSGGQPGSGGGPAGAGGSGAGGSAAGSSSSTVKETGEDAGCSCRVSGAGYLGRGLCFLALAWLPARKRRRPGPRSARTCRHG